MKGCDKSAFNRNSFLKHTLSSMQVSQEAEKKSTLDGRKEHKIQRRQQDRIAKKEILSHNKITSHPDCDGGTKTNTSTVNAGHWKCYTCLKVDDISNHILAEFDFEMVEIQSSIMKSTDANGIEPT